MVSGTSLEEATRRFFEGAKRGLDDLRGDRMARLRQLQQEVPRFFEGARQGLRILAPVVAELDRHLARRFSTFAYIDLDENLMSDVLADLLRPDFVHGQGDLFLESLLSQLGKDEERRPVRHRMACLLPDGSTRSQVQVDREARTTHIEAERRRIDILISMRVDKSPDRVAIAIENKPSSKDEEDQLQHYADHLESQYGGRYLLLYLTPDGGPPDPVSIKPHRRAQLEKQGRFACVKLDQWLDGWMREAESQVKASYVQHFVADFRQALLDRYVDSETGPALGPVWEPVVR